MKKILAILVGFTVLLSILTGCGEKKEEKVETISGSSTIDSIEITSGGYPVVVQTGSVSEITYTIASEEVTAIEENGLLSIAVPEPKAGVNLSSAPTLTVTLPQKQLQRVSIKASNAGDISISNIDALAIDINIEFGNIEIKGLAGAIYAQTGMGEINSSLADISADIVTDGVSASVDGQIGTNTDKTIRIVSEYGFISID